MPLSAQGMHTGLEEHRRHCWSQGAGNATFSNARVQYADQLTAAILLLLSEHPLKAIGATHSQRPARSFMGGLLLRKCYDARRRMPNADSGVIFGASEWVLFPETVVQVDPPISPWNQSLPKWVARETSTLPL
jgi:hypothetical protein